jgi:hypothetical protein
MGDLDWIESYPVGSTVQVADKSQTLGGMNPYSFCGCVKKLDIDGGVCVELFISRIYTPYFWFNWSKLKKIPNQELGTIAIQIETAVGGRTMGGAIADTPIMRGMLRSWMLVRLSIPPGHELEDRVLKMSFGQLVSIYVDTTETQWALWLSVNDSRPKRPRIRTPRMTGAGFGDILSVKRNKIGG